jgi:hypothetical protein
VASGDDLIPALYPLDGGERVEIPGLVEDDVPVCFTPDGLALFVARYRTSPPLVERIEIATGKARPWTWMRGGQLRGVSGYSVLVTPDGASYAYSYLRGMGAHYLMTGLK